LLSKKLNKKRSENKKKPSEKHKLRESLLKRLPKRQKLEELNKRKRKQFELLKNKLDCVKLKESERLRLLERPQ